MTGTAAEALVDRVEELLRRQIGLRPESTLRGRLRRSLRDEAAAQALTPEQFVDAVTARPDALQGLLDRVTVQETSFFRHPEHFLVLAEEVLPTLTAPVTMWSAASSNGQEAYSLAMVLAEQGLAGSVVATDLSTSAVQRTATGRYSTREMSGLTAERIARHFTRVDNEWQVNDDLRRRVTAHRHNLVGPIPDRVRACQVVFCRNVLIYFSPEHATTFVDRVADLLPGAAMFLGGAEAMWPISRRYETVRAGSAFWYRPQQAAPASTPPPPPARLGGRPSGLAVVAPPVPGPAAVHRVSRPASMTVGCAESRTPGDAVVAGLTHAGQRALDRGDQADAIVAFRKCAYLTPDDPVAHLHLGLALEA
ncbi:MAG: CheR family methyltransferase, partial [Nakamurella sp.]